MERLTRKSDYHFEHYNTNSTLSYILNKLGQLEDIEEELGIDLITLFKALKNGVYVKEGSGKIKYYNPDQIAVNWVGYYLEIVFLNTAKKGDYCALNTNAYKLPYTPTWALTKEELENGRVY